ncbi:MAG: RDD family protein [Chitinophagales bacterium]|nr:RDD family protein [Chitinophagales bacterium]
MISQPTQPDPIDKLLEKIVREAEAEQRQLATFTQRAIARTVDTLMVFGTAYLFEAIAIYFIKQSKPFNEDFIIKSVQQAMPALALMLWVMLYSPIMESTGGTLGKRLVRIKLIDATTSEMPPFRMCAARAWVYMIFVILAGVPAVLSCLAFFVSDHHQTWHDKIANMVCVKK